MVKKDDIHKKVMNRKKQGKKMPLSDILQWIAIVIAIMLNIYVYGKKYEFFGVPNNKMVYNVK